jgi:hypothetical protein
MEVFSFEVFVPEINLTHLEFGNHVKKPKTTLAYNLKDYSTYQR